MSGDGASFFDSRICGGVGAHHDAPLPNRLLAILAAMTALALAGCVPAPIPRGPVETGPAPGETIHVFTPEATEAPAPSPAPETAVGEGVVAGQVIMGSPGSSASLAGMDVTLRAVTVAMETGALTALLTRTAVTDAGGAFRFEGLPVGPTHLFYEVSAVYNGVPFSAWVVADAENAALSIPLTIYEATDDAGVITVDAMHVVVSRYHDALSVFQMLVYSNQSDRIYVNPVALDDGRRVSVRAPIPPNAANVIFDEDATGVRFVITGGSAYDTEYVLPGSRSHVISFSYLLPGDTSEIVLPITYPTARVNVLAQPGLRVRSPALTAAGVETIEATPYDAYTGGAMAPGAALTLRFSAPGIGVGAALAILLAGAALAAGIVWIIRRRPHAGWTPRQTMLIRQIADLDGAFEAGRINRLDYEARRADLKARLAEDSQND